MYTDMTVYNCESHLSKLVFGNSVMEGVVVTHRLPRVGATRVGDGVSIGNTVPVARVGGGESDEGQNKRCIHGDSLPINESDECSGDSCRGLTVVYVKDSPPFIIWPRISNYHV